MVSLFNSFNNIRESYYRISIKPNEQFDSDNGSYAKKFFDKHFERGSNKGVFSIYRQFTLEYSQHGKHYHTVSLCRANMNCSMITF